MIIASIHLKTGEVIRVQADEGATVDQVRSGFVTTMAENTTIGVECCTDKASYVFSFDNVSFIRVEDEND